MGYWSKDWSEDGPVWGDDPADLMAAAVEKIAEIFEKDMGREPTIEELHYGLDFVAEGAR